ncbi:MAG: hypothetical protein KAQ62_20525 [Cyclobacteriaceae bacterium]|nr:hypothetical protein [Cyclobacteriaceae bacterium]
MPTKLFKNIFLLLFLMPFLVFSQKETPKKKEGYGTRMEKFRVKKKDFKKNRYLTVGGSFNFLTYFGDLAPATNFLSTEFSQIKPGVSAFIQYRYGPRMSLKAELLYGRLTGDDFTSADPNDPEAISRYVRNLSFRNDILDFSVMSQFYIFKNYLDFRQRKFFNIYLNGGISIFYHNPKGKVPDFKISGERYPNSGEWVVLRPLGTEGQFSEFYDNKPYSKIQFSIPFGGGFNFRLTDRLDFSFEVNYRILLTDYIDDVSGKYVDLGALGSDVAKSMSDRSREEYAVMTGKERDYELILSNTKPVTYISKYDGNRYIVFQGYGQESSGAIRGGSSNDTYIVTSFKISYVLNKSKPREN